MRKRPVPALSSVVIVFGASGILWRGELIIITGRLTTYTHTACEPLMRPSISTSPPRGRNGWLAREKERAVSLLHLECPEHGEADHVAATVVESLVAADLDDPVEEVSGEPRAPQAHEDGHHDLPAVVRLRGGERERCYLQRYGFRDVCKVKRASRKKVYR